jgi:hypothetical protein
MAKPDHTLAYTFRGSAEQLSKLRQVIRKALQEAVPPINPGGPVEDWGQSGGWVQDLKDGWGQSGGWYLVIEKDEKIQVSRPDKALTKVTATVYKALSKAKQTR